MTLLKIYVIHLVGERRRIIRIIAEYLFDGDQHDWDIEDDKLILKNRENNIVHVQQLQNIESNDTCKDYICNIVEKGVFDLNKQYDIETSSKYLLH